MELLPPEEHDPKDFLPPEEHTELLPPDENVPSIPPTSLETVGEKPGPMVPHEPTDGHGIPAGHQPSGFSYAQPGSLLHPSDLVPEE